MDFVNKDRDVRVAVAANPVADGCGTVGERYAVGYVLTFEDGEQSEQVLHIGTKEECERVADLVPAVAVSGPRAVKAAQMVMIRLDEEVPE